MSNFQHESEFNSPALNDLIREGLFDLPPADGVLYYCPQCSVVFLKFPNKVISPSTEPRRTLAETFGYLWCERCSGDFQDEKVMLQLLAPRISPSENPGRDNAACDRTRGGDVGHEG